MPSAQISTIISFRIHFQIFLFLRISFVVHRHLKFLRQHSSLPSLAPPAPTGTGSSPTSMPMPQLHPASMLLHCPHSQPLLSSNGTSTGGHLLLNNCIHQQRQQQQVPLLLRGPLSASVSASNCHLKTTKTTIKTANTFDGSNGIPHCFGLFPSLHENDFGTFLHEIVVFFSSIQEVQMVLATGFFCEVDPVPGAIPHCWEQKDRNNQQECGGGGNH